MEKKKIKKKKNQKTAGGWLKPSLVKNLTSNAGDMGLIPGSGTSLRGENSNPPQYSCLGNPMDRGASKGTVL